MILVNHDNLCVGGEGKSMLGVNAHIWRKIITCETLQSSQHGEVPCFDFRLELTSVCFLLTLSWNLTDFIPEKINSLQWEDPQVSAQLVDKWSGDGHFRIELLTVLYVYCMLYLHYKQKIGGGGRVNVCFHISTKWSIWCLNRLQLNRMATNIHFFHCQLRNNMLFCALYCVLVLSCRQCTTEIN